MMLGSTFRAGALALLLGASAQPASATPVRVIDTWTFVDGHYAGETITHSVTYDLPPETIYLSTAGVSKVMFRDVSAIGVSSVINVFPDDLDQVEITASYQFDPESNLSGISNFEFWIFDGLFYPNVNGVAQEFQTGGPCILPIGECSVTTFQRETYYVPIPATVLLLGGSLAWLFGLGRAAAWRRVNRA